MVYTICVYSAGRKQKGIGAEAAQYDDRLFALRTMARGKLDVRIVGRRCGRNHLSRNVIKATVYKAVKKNAHKSAVGNFVIHTSGNHAVFVFSFFRFVPCAKYRGNRAGVRKSVYGGRIRRGVLDLSLIHI